MALEPLFSLSLGAQLVVGMSFALYLLPERRWPWLLLGALLGASAVRLHWLQGLPWRIYASTLTRCDAFAFGALAAYLVGHPTLHAPLRKHAGVPLGAASLALAVQFLFFGRLRIDQSATVVVGYPLVGLWCGALVTYAVLRPQAPRARLLTSLAPLVLCVYLVKLPIEHAIAQGLGGALDGWGALGHAGLGLAMVSAAGLAGVLLHHGVERPLRAWLTRALAAHR
jgi:peptidoglycan/LPS O-acetylase OafA/YrhL